MHHTKQARSQSVSRAERRTSAASSGSSAGDGLSNGGSGASFEDSAFFSDEERVSHEQTVQLPFRQKPLEGQTPKLPDVVVEDADVAIEQNRLARSATLAPAGQDENWRHGDIKPENMLRFINGAPGMGVLKLADLGRAKGNQFKTQDRMVIEKDRYRTKPYEPPDIYMRPNESMSRLFDVWSLGCVMFEAIVWMLYGKALLRSFTMSTKTAELNETPFWYAGPNWQFVDISPIVKNWMEHILDNDPECTGSKPSAIKDLLELVFKKMLVINLHQNRDMYTPGYRAPTSTILEDLAKIRSKVKQDPTYLFTGRSRDPRSFNPPPDTELVLPSKIPKMGAENQNKSQSGSFLEVNNASVHRGLNTKQRNTYSHHLEDKWNYEDDEHFARTIILRHGNAYQTECVPLDSDIDEQNPCRVCRQPKVLDWEVWKDRKVADLKKGCKTGCGHCVLLQKRAIAAGLTEGDPISISMTDAGLTINSGHTVLDRQLQLRISRTPDKGISAVQFPLTMPLGRPLLPSIRSDATFLLLSAWLKDCDSGHGNRKLGCMPSSSSSYIPRRLLDVGEDKQATFCKLVESGSASAASSIRYAALSHPWGVKSRENQHFVSTVDNIRQHMERILDSELPNNFRDAVFVARRLGIRYVWIDAVCILQATDSHPGDFHREAGKMQEMFSSAYCVLAASSAKGMQSGFLSQGDETPREDRKAIELYAGPSGKPVFVCESRDDFQRDVIEGPLSSRAWAFQERALARRTIFFTNNQIYWECSGGIRCETMSKLANSQAAFLGDSNFPSYAVSKNNTVGDQIFLYTGLYEHFSRLDFSRNSDKPFGIIGLEQRLTQTLKDTSGAGIFGQHKGRCLLWQRADGVRRLERIVFPTLASGYHKPATWSFMAHNEAITYIPAPSEVDWTSLDLNLTGSADKSWLYEQNPLSFYANAFSFKIESAGGIQIHYLAYDDPDSDWNNDKCVILGKFGGIDKYIMVVRPTGASGLKGPLYERAGIGWIPAAWIDEDKNRIPIEIV